MAVQISVPMSISRTCATVSPWGTPKSSPKVGATWGHLRAERAHEALLEVLAAETPLLDALGAVELVGLDDDLLVDGRDASEDARVLHGLQPEGADLGVQALREAFAVPGQLAVEVHVPDHAIDL